VTLNSGDLEKTIRNLGFRYIRMGASWTGMNNIVYESSDPSSTFSDKRRSLTSWLPAGSSCRNALGVTQWGSNHSFIDVDTLYWDDSYNGSYTNTEWLLVCPFMMAYGDQIYVWVWTRSSVTIISSVWGDTINFAAWNASHRYWGAWLPIWIK
jgi:hypothetical protein